ncbi:hypothetical protein ANANG_G00026710 [Anguilla anguilla]|uniref:Thymidine kinase n=1 Tax=Anguilla anguilla TaxID=7936 RepID=A0A9D3MR94_ANGAN|nr:hypothetical protein ANANG_G00026710 [Anguilla anguilla]
MDCLNVSQILPNSPRKTRGQIQVIFGPMFSGKSTELMRRVRRFQIAQYQCLVIKYAKDTRYSDNDMATHDKYTMAAVRVGAGRRGDRNRVGTDTVDFCEDMANRGKTVIVAALDGTFQRKPFGDILGLVPLAESVVKLNAVCMHCYKEAAYTKRLGSETEVEVIGGADKYHAACRSCYGGLVADKENSAPKREETPPHALPGKQLDSSTPRKLFAALHI